MIQKLIIVDLYITHILYRNVDKMINDNLKTIENSIKDISNYFISKIHKSLVTKTLFYRGSLKKPAIGIADFENQLPSEVLNIIISKLNGFAVSNNYNNNHNVYFYPVKAAVITMYLTYKNA